MLFLSILYILLLCPGLCFQAHPLCRRTSSSHLSSAPDGNVEARVLTIETKFTRLEGDVIEMKGDMKQLKGDIQNLSKDVERLSKDVERLSKDVERNSMETKADIEKLSMETKADIEKLSTEIREMNRNIQEVSNKFFPIYVFLAVVTTAAGMSNFKDFIAFFK